MQEAVLVFDASTFNPDKNFKTTKPRLKAKTQRQLRDQTIINSLFAKLKYQKKFNVNELRYIAWQDLPDTGDQHVLIEVERLAADNPNCLVIFITRDQGFTYSSMWRPYSSRVYVMVLPLFTCYGCTRLDMAKIIAADIRDFLNFGHVCISNLHSPELLN